MACSGEPQIMKLGVHCLRNIPGLSETAAAGDLQLAEFPVKSHGVGL
jgi:hypothetical protein